MSTLQQNLQRPFYIKHLLERLRYGKAAVAMRREAADLIEKMNEDSSNLSAQNSYQAMRIEELQRDLAAAQQEAITAGGAVDILNQQLAAAQEARQRAEALAEQNAKDAKEAIAIASFLFDAWEDGTPCFETDGESGMGASIGKAFKLSNEDFTRCTEFLNRVDPRGAAIDSAMEAK